MRMSSFRNLTENQRGVASLMVTTVLILVLGLIIVGFSQATRRNQRETLDRQLSTQAFYAAESGVNGVIAAAEATLQAGSAVDTQDSCDGSSYPVNDLQDGVEVTCLLVSNELESLNYSDVTESSGTIVPLEGANNEQIGSVELTWYSKEGTATPADACANNTNLPDRAGWGDCGYGLLRVDASPSASGDTSATAMTTFFKPRNSASGGSIGYSLGGGGLVLGNCNNSQCVGRITGMGGTSYYLHVRSLYKDASLSVRAFTPGGAPILLTGQLQIDSTGKAQDVLRRIQVRAPLQGQLTNNIPLNAIESTSSICKRFTVAPDYYDEDNPALCS